MLASMFMVAGLIQNRVGPRAVATVGGLLFSCGLFLASFIHTLPMLYLTWGVMLGAGLGFGYLAPITVGSKWFPNQRGLVNGLAIGIFAAGSGIFGPLADRLIAEIGWRGTFQSLAGLFFVFTMVGAAMMKDPPDSYLIVPPATASGKPRALNVDVPTTQVLQTPSFYLLWIAYALGTTAGTMVISQLVPFARSAGYSAPTAAFAITVAAGDEAFADHRLRDPRCGIDGSWHRFNKRRGIRIAWKRARAYKPAILDFSQEGAPV